MAGRRGAETMNNNNKKLIVYSKVLLPSTMRRAYMCVYIYVPLRFVCFITPLGVGGGVGRGGSATIVHAYNFISLRILQ